MESTPTPEEHVIHLSHAAADDGDWSEVAPETVRALTSYLTADQFLALTKVRFASPLFEPPRKTR